jgi:hypothetical protein
MPSPPPPRIPQLPSRKVGAVLAALMLAAGIALGALLGSGPAASLANASRASALGHVLAVIGLESGTGSGSEPLRSAGAAHPPATATQPTPTPSSKASAGTGGGAAGRSAGRSSRTSPSSPSSSAPGSTSPTSSTKPAASEGEGEKTHKTEPLPPIANVWLVVLPYGASVGNTLKQSTAPPYLAQLAKQGTVLSGYSSLAAGQLAGAATLLSGQVTASVNTLAPPPCGTAATSSAGAGQPAAAGQAAASTPCPSGEPAGAQAADAFLQEAVPKIVASASYTEHGLIVITFAPSSGAATTPSAGTTEAAGSVAYPAGSLTSTVTAAAPAGGALLLSPFLRHAGTQSASAFDATSPRTSLEGLLQAKAAGG